MTAATSVADLALYRKRLNAQQLSRALWALYAQNVGLAVHNALTSPVRIETTRDA